LTTPVAVVIAIAGVVVGLLAEQLGHGFDQVAWIPLTDLATGWAMIGSGIVAVSARPRQVAGKRLILAGFLWFVGSFQAMDDFRFGSLAFALQGYFDLVLILIALSFPARWPMRTSERAVVAVAALLFIASSIARVLARSQDILGVTLLDPEVALPWVGWLDFTRLAAIVVAGVFVIGRWLRATPTERRVVGPVIAAGAASALAVAFALLYPLGALGLMTPLDDRVYIPLAWLFNTVRILVPFGMLLGIVRQRAARTAVADAVAAAGEAPATPDLRGVLAQALGDEGLRVLEWSDDRAAFVSGDGTIVPASLPEEPGRSTAIVRAGDQSLAALVYDSALDEDPAIVAAAVGVTRLAIQNQRLTRESARRLEEAEASRARIVEAGDLERRRIERDLHDGIQQRLVALAMALSRAQSNSPDQEAAAAALGYGASEALGIVEDVREFASGIHPAILTEAGLGAALRELADRSPIPVELELHLLGRGSPSAHATAFFIVSEALANTTKHAQASEVWVHARDDRNALEVSVEDDGRGGAVIGGGLQGLVDRVNALGGTLAIGDRAGGGTAVIATLPLA
jgi:signal transduction histidine kinase